MGRRRHRRLIRISTTTTRAKRRNLLRAPRTVLHVPGADFFTFAVVEGGVPSRLPPGRRRTGHRGRR